MQLVIDEQEQAHIYSCLLVGNAEFGKVKKSLAKLNREDDQIDDEINLNAKLRRIFNPRAEEEARERARSKDPAQMDLTEAGSSGETGGGIPAGQTFSLNTGPAKTAAEIRDALLELGIAVQLDSIELEFGDETEGGWTEDQKSEVVSWIEAARAAQANSEAIPDAPEVVERDGVTVSRMNELLAAGPFSVHEVTGDDIVNGQPFEVQREGAETIDSAFADKLDAQIEAAYLNRLELRRADMSDDEIAEWAGKGPWEAKVFVLSDDGNDVDEWYIAAGTQREVCEDEADAMGRAARYNRSITQQPIEANNSGDASEQTDDERPEQITDDQAREIAVAAGRAD